MRAQAQLFAPGTSSRAKYAALVVGRARAARAAEVRADRLGDAGVARRARAAAQEDLLSEAARRLGTECRLREGRHAPAPAQDSHRQQRGRRRPLPARRQGRIRTAASASATASSSAGTPSCRARTGTSSVDDDANIGFNCEIFSASRVTIGRSVLMAAYSYVVGGDHDRSDPTQAGARSGPHLIGRDDRRWRVDWRWSQDPGRRRDRRPMRSWAPGPSSPATCPAHTVAVGVPARVVSTPAS